MLKAPATHTHAAVYYRHVPACRVVLQAFLEIGQDPSAQAKYAHDTELLEVVTKVGQGRRAGWAGARLDRAAHIAPALSRRGALHNAGRGGVGRGGAACGRSSP